MHSWAIFFTMSCMPLQKHEVQSFNQNSVAPPSSASENHSSSYDEQANNLSTADSTKSEQPDWDPANHGSTNRKAPQVAKGTIQLLKSLLLPIVGEDIHLGNEPSILWRSTSAIAYLTFCYTVHDRMIPVAANNFLTLNASPANIGYFLCKINFAIPVIYYASFSNRKVRDNLHFYSYHHNWTLAVERPRWKHQGTEQWSSSYSCNSFFWFETERRVFP